MKATLKPKSKHDLLMDTINHKTSGPIPHWIDFEPGIAHKLSRHYGVDDIFHLVENAIELIDYKRPNTSLTPTLIGPSLKGHRFSKP
ncbi:MAG: hypothetical protein JRH15_13335, partial [Deltaproteobacteria bacterium]|nr:hypothetical protein [Deltaproteobacteria bacterium]